MSSSCAEGTAERAIMLGLMAMYRVKEHIRCGHFLVYFIHSTASDCLFERTIRNDVWKTYLGKPVYPYMGHCLYGE